MRQFILLLLLALALSGCGSSSDNSSSAGTQSFTLESAAVTINVPRDVSSTASTHELGTVKLTIIALNGSANIPSGLQNTYNIALTTSNTTTQTTGEQAVIPLTIPSGTISLDIEILDAKGDIISLAPSVTMTVKSNTPNQTFNIQTQGVVNNVKVILPTITLGQPFNGPITVDAYDPSGALIIGSTLYANIFMLVDQDTTDATSLTVGTVTSTQVNVTGPKDVVNLHYNGANIQQIQITVQSPTLKPVTIKK